MLRALADLLSPAFAVGTARLVARLFDQHLTAKAGAQVDAVVVALRASGVLLCLLAERDLWRCRCLRALASAELDEHVRAEVRDVVSYGLDRVEQSSRSVS